MNTAIVIGATGLTGSELVKQLITNNAYNKIIVLVRKPLLIQHNNLHQLVIDFDKMESFISGLTASHAYCCLGTTIKKAGSKANQTRIDHTYVIEFAKACKQIGVEAFGVVSSLGADKNSSNFYLQTKGNMEFDLQQIGFTSLVIVRPSLLLGNRNEYRFGEQFATLVMKLVNPLLIGSLKKYRAINVTQVASGLIKALTMNNAGLRIIDSDKI